MLNIRSVSHLVQDSDMAYLFRLCVNSKFVEENTRYREIAAKTDFIPDMDSRVINAYASHPDERYRIQLLGGLVDWVGHFSFIKTLFDVGMPMDKVAKLAEWTRQYVLSLDPLDDEESGWSSEVTRKMVNEVKMDLAKYKIDSNSFAECWRSNLLDCVHACIAHELGHLCLGHCDCEGYDGTIMSSNRNIERQADLFSFSVIQCGTGVAAKSVGAVLLEVSFFCLSASYDSDSTHPSSSERIDNAIQSFKGIIPPKDVELCRKMVALMSKVKKPKKKPKPKAV